MGLGKTAQLCVHFGSLARDYAHSSSISMSTLSPSMNSPNETSSSSAKFSSKNRYAGPVRIPLRKREEASSIFLVVCPATVIHHWLRELHVWAPLMRCVVLHSISATGGELSRLGEQSEFEKSAVLLCPYLYECLQHSIVELAIRNAVSTNSYISIL